MPSRMSTGTLPVQGPDQKDDRSNVAARAIAADRCSSSGLSSLQYAPSINHWCGEDALQLVTCNGFPGIGPSCKQRCCVACSWRGENQSGKKKIIIAITSVEVFRGGLSGSKPSELLFEAASESVEDRVMIMILMPSSPTESQPIHQAKAT